MLAAILIDTLGVRRGLKSKYFIFSDPLIILAGERLCDLSFNRWAYGVGIAPLALHIAVGQSELLTDALKRSGP